MGEMKEGKRGGLVNTGSLGIQPLKRRLLVLMLVGHQVCKTLVLVISNSSPPKASSKPGVAAKKKALKQNHDMYCIHDEETKLTE